MLTNDCTGTYDYEAEEGKSEAEYMIELSADYTPDEMADKFIKTRAYWKKCLDSGYPDFQAAFNAEWNNRMGIAL